MAVLPAESETVLDLVQQCNEEIRFQAVSLKPDAVMDRIIGEH